MKIIEVGVIDIMLSLKCFKDSLKKLLFSELQKEKIFQINENYQDSEETIQDSLFNDIETLGRGIKYETYYENWENQNFKSLLKDRGCLELKLVYGNNVLSDSFGFRNVGIEESVMKCADFNFRFKSIVVSEKYRKIGVCSCLLLKAIIVVLENLSDFDVEFSLVNTTNIDIKNKFYIYNSILTDIVTKENLQYKLFSSVNRISDLEHLRKQYEIKLNMLLAKL